MANEQQNFPQGNGNKGQYNQPMPPQFQNQPNPYLPPNQPYPQQGQPQQYDPYYGQPQGQFRGQPQGHYPPQNQQFQAGQYPPQYPGQYGPGNGQKKKGGNGILIALIVIVSIAIIALLAFMAFGFFGSDQKSSPANVPSASAKTTVTVDPEPTVTVTRHIDWPPTGATKSCSSSIMVNDFTSCPFADNVFSEFDRHGDGEIEVYSPTTEKNYTMSCSTSDGVAICTGGNNAVVWIKR